MHSYNIDYVYSENKFHTPIGLSTHKGYGYITVNNWLLVVY